MSSKNIIIEFFESFNKGPNAVLNSDLISPSAMWWSNGSETLSTRSGNKPFAKQAASYFHTSSKYKVDERCEILDIITDGKEKFVVELVVTAKGVTGLYTAGRTYTGHMVIKIVVRDGKIVEFREHKDNLAGLLFLGENAVREEACARL